MTPRFELATQAFGVSRARGWWFFLFAATGWLLLFLFVSWRLFFSEVGTKNSKLVSGTDECVGLLEINRQLDGRLGVESAAVSQLERQYKSLQLENANLREGLALFETIAVSPLAASEVIKVARLTFESSPAAGRYRYSALIFRQLSSKSVPEFVGEIQFHLKAKRAERDVIIDVPGEGNPPAGHFRFSVRHFFRADGEFTLPVDVKLTGGEFRIVQQGVVKFRQQLAM